MKRNLTRFLNLSILARMHAWWGHVPTSEKCPIKFNKIIRQSTWPEHTTNADPKTWSSFLVPRMFIWNISRWLCKRRFLDHKKSRNGHLTESMCANQTTTDSFNLHTQRGKHRRKCFLFLDALVYGWALRNLIWRSAHLSHTRVHSNEKSIRLPALMVIYFIEKHM